MNNREDETQAEACLDLSCSLAHSYVVDVRFLRVVQSRREFAAHSRHALSKM